MRSNGLSHVRAAACLEFFVKLLNFRFGGELTRWQKARPRVVASSELSGT
jgi:hypothetical protein